MTEKERVVFAVMWRSCGMDTVRDLFLSQHSAEVEAANLRKRNMNVFVRPMRVRL